MSATPRVLGADVFEGRWVGVVLGEGPPTAHLAATVAELLAAVGGAVDAVGLDIPIGLPDAGRRRADAQVRALVGARSSSVFTTPVRAAVLTADHGEAVAVNRVLAGEGLSRQAHGLRHRILEVDAWAPGAGVPVVEVHPELSFAVLAGAPLATRKRSWAGAEQRRALLAGAGIVLPGDLGAAGAAAVDDVLDAVAVAWSTARYAAGTAVSHPDPPERSSDGWPAAIWA